jgi:hypothetical protein
VKGDLFDLIQELRQVCKPDKIIAHNSAELNQDTLKWVDPLWYMREEE